MNRVTRSASRKTNATKDPVKPTSRRQPKKVIESSSESDYEEENIFSVNNRKTNQRTPVKQRLSLDALEPDSVTPPKMRRIQPGNEITMTPSSMLKKLALTSPVKKVSVKTPSSKKTLFTQNDHEPDEHVSKNNLDKEVSKSKANSRKASQIVDERKESSLKLKIGKPPIKRGSTDDSKASKIIHEADETRGKKLTQYQNARKALHSNFPTDMPGRETEIEKIREFIETHLESETSGSIYISGPPGTGKTASLNLILDEKHILNRVQKIYLNCTAIKSATAVYSRLNKELNIKVSGKTEKDNLAAFEKNLKKKNKTVLIVLDEIDQLETKNHSILYTIFEWPSKFESGMILVGIANALDLTDRMLPRLQARCELKPKLLHFAPYTKEQIVHIFTSRLKDAGVLDVFSPIALQMLAGKVASISGDVRRALDIGRRVVELIDQNKKGDVLQSVENFTNELDKENKSDKKVNLQEVVSVLNNVYGTTQNMTDDNEETFPLQQKIVVCSLLLMLKKAKNKDITVGKLHEVYTKVCSKKNMSGVDQAEFVGLCSLIETRGIIRISGRKEPRMHKVSLEWNESEVSEALRDKQLMSTILQDESVLGKI